MTDFKILSGIKSPQDIKKLSKKQTDSLCREIRDCIIDTVSKNGGHLASNLGAVELTVALHRVFNSPEDAIIFDVGHQCYAHKLLTGRFDRFSTIRTENGISGFMRPTESEHDAFITGHSSNSLSAAYGIYKAKCLSHQKGTAIAVIGDGAMTGGMAYEALNNIGSEKSKFIVVINDNKMSISKSVGSMARVFSKMRNTPWYHSFKSAIGNLILKTPFIGRSVYLFIFKIKEVFKRVVYKNNFFAALGFNYLGPVDGHNVEALEDILNIAKKYNRPSIIHAVTVKGKGYSYAESKPSGYHGVSAFDVEKGTEDSSITTFSDIAGKTLCEIAEINEKVCAVTAAMKSGTGLTDFSRQFKNRFFDVGIAEEHAVTFAAGLAKGGMVPFFAVYSTFLQRGYDQIIHDAAIANLPLKLLVDRAGFVGEDGETHQGLFDVPFLSTVPNMNIYSPCYYGELEKLIKDTAKNSELCAIRYPRGCEKGRFDGELCGDYTLVSRNSDNLLVTYGRLFSNALVAGENFDIIKLNKIFPISDETISKILKYKNVHFFEEGMKSGGIAEHIGSRLAEMEFNGKYFVHAVDGCFVAAANVTSTIKKYGLDTDAMKKAFEKE